jgi:flagellar basal-body rod modification protein FlgD
MPTAPIPTTGVNSQPSSGPNRNEALRGLDLDQFLKLMITELQNQDPLNPMENSEILQQITQIREIEATSRLGETLDAVMLGQAINSATSMIGKKVRALAGQGGVGEEVAGVVDRVSVAEGKPLLHIGDKSFALDRVREIVASEPQRPSLLPT